MTRFHPSKKDGRSLVLNTRILWTYLRYERLDCGFSPPPLHSISPLMLVYHSLAAAAFAASAFAASAAAAFAAAASAAAAAAAGAAVAAAGSWPQRRSWF